LRRAYDYWQNQPGCCHQNNLPQNAAAKQSTTPARTTFAMPPPPASPSKHRLLHPCRPTPPAATTIATKQFLRLQCTYRTFTHMLQKVQQHFSRHISGTTSVNFQLPFCKNPTVLYPKTGNTHTQGAHIPHYEPSPASRPVNNNTTPHTTPRDRMSCRIAASLASFLTTEAQHSVRIRPKHHCIRNRRAYRVSTAPSAAMP